MMIFLNLPRCDISVAKNRSVRAGGAEQHCPPHLRARAWLCSTRDCLAPRLEAACCAFPSWSGSTKMCKWGSSGQSGATEPSHWTMVRLFSFFLSFCDALTNFYIEHHDYEEKTSLLATLPSSVMGVRGRRCAAIIEKTRTGELVEDRDTSRDLAAGKITS
jgi:hypothetical protein